MEASGSRCELRTYEDQEHAFFNYRDGSNRYYNATVYETDRFLESLGFLDGEPTLTNPIKSHLRPAETSDS